MLCVRIGLQVYLIDDMFKTDPVMCRGNPWLMVIGFLLKLRLNFAVVVLSLTGQCIGKIMFESISVQFTEAGGAIQLDNSL